MPNKYSYLVVTLDRDISEDEFKSISIAINAMKRVVNVKGRVSNMDTWAADMRARTQLINQVMEVLVGGNSRRITEVANGDLECGNGVVNDDIEITEDIKT